MAAALAVALALALAGSARGQELPILTAVSVASGNGWRSLNDFDVSWSNPPQLMIAGASWRLDAPGYLGPTEFAAGAGLQELHVQVPGPGVWELSLWLREARGFEFPGFAASTPLRFDDVPPVVSFVPVEAQPSPQLSAEVSDPLSGVARGSISYRRLGQERWTDLQSQIRLGASGIELTAATPQLQPGTAYEFRATASDEAGNLGEATLRADGAPKAVSAQPGRDGTPTRLAAGLSAGRDRGGRARLIVDAGERVVLRGRLSDRHGALAGRRLRVVSRPAQGGRGGTEVETVRSRERGRFELRLPAGPSRRISVVFAGGEGLRPTRRRLSLRVRGEISLRATPRRLRTGELLRLRGRVGSRGARVPRSGKLVTISYWERETRRWRPAIVTRTDRSGDFSAAYRFRYVSGRALIRLRATAPAEAEWPYAPGSSPPLTVEVDDR